MIRQLARSKHLISILLLPAVVGIGISSAVQGQTASSSPSLRVRNADWNISGDQILITYDLVATKEGEYDVRIVLLNESEKTFKVTPKAVAGDVGDVRGPAKQKVIRWDYTKDLHPNLNGPGYYFGFEVQESGGASPLAIILIVAGLAGVAVLMFSGGDE